FHMDLPGLNAAKKVMSAFVDGQMGQNDQVAIASATNQIGFLQQLTNERMILRKAMDRLTVRGYSVRDPERPPMTEYEAFLIESRRGDSITRLRDITNAAARSGVVIYSMDTRGLVAPFGDATREVPFDPSGVLITSTHGELSATQDGMNALAVDTGGKAIFNTNDLKQGLAPAMKE